MEEIVEEESYSMSARNKYTSNNIQIKDQSI